MFKRYILYSVFSWMYCVTEMDRRGFIVLYSQDGRISCLQQNRVMSKNKWPKYFPVKRKRTYRYSLELLSKHSLAYLTLCKHWNHISFHLVLKMTTNVFSLTDVHGCYLCSYSSTTFLLLKQGYSRKCINALHQSLFSESTDFCCKLAIQECHVAYK